MDACLVVADGSSPRVRCKLLRDLAPGEQVVVGHGSGIRQAVEQGLIQSGIMKTLVEDGVPYVLAGSIRDDGPLPDTLMDLNEAQRQYQEHLRGVEMILMLSTMLHSIGVGNMTPSGVKMICVDISPAVATKLADRGSLESVGIVTDVGLFLRLLAEKLGVEGGARSPGVGPRITT